MRLNGLAKTIQLLDDQVTASFLPYHTLRSKFCLQDLIAAWGESEGWTVEQTNFWLLSSTLVDLQASKKAQKADYRARSLLYWWTNRGDDLLESYELYRECVAIDVLDPLIDAYNATRQDLPPASPALIEGKPEDEDADPEGLSAGVTTSATS